MNNTKELRGFSRLVSGLFLVFAFTPALGQESADGLRGDPLAIADAQAMVETMGGMEIWSQLRNVHFVHEWYFWNRIDAYLENEILDLTGPRSWVDMRSEIYHRLRAYSPEHGYWNVVNGQFGVAPEQALNAAMERAPFNLYRIARAVALGDPWYEVRFVPGEFPETQQLEFAGPDGVPLGWVQLNARKEPLVWSTTQYKYTFGPMKSFGNLRVPDWASTGDGAVTYQMVSLTGSNQPVDSSLFVPPAEYLDPANG